MLWVYVLDLRHRYIYSPRDIGEFRLLPILDILFDTLSRGKLMERLTLSQQEALEQLQGVLGYRNYDVDVLMDVLQTLDWDVQVMVPQTSTLLQALTLT